MLFRLIMEDLLKLVEEKLQALREADSALGTTKVVGLSQIDKQTADSAIGGGLEDKDTKDDVVSGGATTIAVGDLKPAQTEIIKEKAFGMAIGLLLDNKYKSADLGNIVSKDNYIMDGHHRWAAINLINPSESVKVTKIDLPGGPLVTALNLVTKGKYGIDRGNKGKGNVAEFTGANLEKVIDNALSAGIKGEYPKTPEDVKKALGLIPGAEGDAAKGKEIMMSNADSMPKQIMPGAPARVEMPVIGPDQVKTVQSMLAKGQIDIEEPFSQGVKAVAETTFPLWNKIKSGAIKEDFDLEQAKKDAIKDLQDSASRGSALIRAYMDALMKYDIGSEEVKKAKLATQKGLEDLGKELK